MTIRRKLFTPAALLFIVSIAVGGTRGERSATSPTHTAADDLYRPFLINQFFNYYGNNGDGAYNKFSATNEGLEYPKGSGKTWLYEEGLLWGGFHKGRATPKVGGSAYRHGIQAGPIIQYGTSTTDPVADDPSNPSNRVYRVRPDINPKTPFVDVQSKIAAEETALIGRYESYSDQDIYDQYVKDWNEWPVASGAPFVYGKDSNNVQRTSGPYDPRYDIPGRPGAHQTLWYVANDDNAVRAANLSNSPPIGLEMRRTVWGYNLAGAGGQAVFESTVLINKSGARVDSMFLMYWSDPDLGDMSDDFVGCDTVRSLGYVYNGHTTDAVYGSQPPAAGIEILQGPIVRGAQGDTASFLMSRRPRIKNLPMTTFDFFINGSPIYTDPVSGVGGDLQWYRLMQGKIAPTGNPFVDPVTALPTKFCLSGDPVTGAGSGWVDGTGVLAPGDRRMCLASGPFTMAAGDTQELVVALIAGLGADRISSIAVLRSNADQVRSAYNSVSSAWQLVDAIATPARQVPGNPELMQNYPNPFNPSTTISYTLPRRSTVTLAIFNTLGQRVASLIQGEQEAGRHDVKFDGGGLTSGVYFYRLEAGDFVQTKRLLLIR